MHQTARLRSADTDALLSVPKDVACSFASILEDGGVILLGGTVRASHGSRAGDVPVSLHGFYTVSKALRCHATEGARIGPTPQA